MTAGSEPRTEAGRRLAGELGARYRIDLILRIEAEAARTADDRLARVVEKLASHHAEVNSYRRSHSVEECDSCALALPAPERPAEPVLDVERLAKAIVEASGTTWSRLTAHGQETNRYHAERIAAVLARLADEGPKP